MGGFADPVREGSRGAWGTQWWGCVRSGRRARGSWRDGRRGEWRAAPRQPQGGRCRQPASGRSVPFPPPAGRGTDGCRQWCTKRGWKRRAAGGAKRRVIETRDSRDSAASTTLSFTAIKAVQVHCRHAPHKQRRHSEKESEKKKEDRGRDREREREREKGDNTCSAVQLTPLPQPQGISSASAHTHGQHRAGGAAPRAEVLLHGRVGGRTSEAEGGPRSDRFFISTCLVARFGALAQRRLQRVDVADRRGAQKLAAQRLSVFRGLGHFFDAAGWPV